MRWPWKQYDRRTPGVIIIALDEYGEDWSTVIVKGGKQAEVHHFGKDGDPVQTYAHDLEDIYSRTERERAIETLMELHHIDVKCGAYEVKEITK